MSHLDYAEHNAKVFAETFLIEGEEQRPCTAQRVWRNNPDNPGCLTFRTEDAHGTFLCFVIVNQDGMISQIDY